MPLYDEERRKWSDRFLPQIQEIVGRFTIGVASYDSDVREATDIVAHSKKIAVRVRQFGFFNKYPEQFTLRAQLDTGTVTELQKIIHGHADWAFYGHADKQEMQVEHWMVLDLHVFRSTLLSDILNKSFKIRWGGKSNGDGTYFKWFDVRTFPPNLIIGCSVPLPPITIEQVA
jgi:hypothetical protein